MIVPIWLYQCFHQHEVELWHRVAHLHWSSFSVQSNAASWKPCNGVPPSQGAWPGEPAWSSCAPRGPPWPRWPGVLGWRHGWWPNGANATGIRACKDLETTPDRDAPRSFPPTVALPVVKLACERPATQGRRLSPWDSAELARELIGTGVVDLISPATVCRILHPHKLKPCRHHMWLSPTAPRAATFYARVAALIDLSTRPRRAHEMGLSVAEKPSLQPCPRLHPTTPAHPGLPNRVEHEYRRDGACTLFAAFDPRTGHVDGQCYSRKRQDEFLALVMYLDTTIPPTIQTSPIVCDKVSVHHGQKVQKWLQAHPRFVFHFTPVHCSWMHQVEQWFPILQRTRFRMVDFESKAALAVKIEHFMAAWHHRAQPFNWSTKSVAKIRADAPAKVA